MIFHVLLSRRLLPGYKVLCSVEQLFSGLVLVTAPSTTLTHLTKHLPEVSHHHAEI